jgi:hypothetical protein
MSVLAPIAKYYAGKYMSNWTLKKIYKDSYHECFTYLCREEQDCGDYETGKFYFIEHLWIQKIITLRKNVVSKIPHLRR